MVGGEVVGLIRRPTGDTTLHVQGKGCEANDYCQVDCVEVSERTNRKVTIGLHDSVWWQGNWVFWTPKKYLMPPDQKRKLGLRSGVDFDVKLSKRGSAADAGHGGWDKVEKK